MNVGKNILNGAKNYVGQINRKVATIRPGRAAAPIAQRKAHRVPFGQYGDLPCGEEGKLIDGIRYREDPWYWLRSDDRKNNEVLNHLKKENQYTESKIKVFKSLVEELEAENLSHLKQTDSSPPHRDGSYFYYYRTEEGKAYSIHCRKRILGNERLPEPQQDEEIILDENVVAEGHTHCDVGSMRVSPGERLLAYTVDHEGDEIYDVYIKDLKTGEIVGRSIKNMSGSLHWGQDDGILFYITEDESKRPYKLWKHVVGTDQSGDVCLFTEDDVKFNLSMYKTKNLQYVFVSSRSKETSESSFIDLKNDDQGLRLFQSREKGVKYSVDYLTEGKFVVTTNLDGALNNRLMMVDSSDTRKTNWKHIIPYNEEIQICGLNIFQKFMVVEGRQNGITQIWTLQSDWNEDFEEGSKVMELVSWDVEEGGHLYECFIGKNKEFDTDKVRLNYTSLITPMTWLDYCVTTRKFTKIQEREVTNYDKSLYRTERLVAIANDGTEIPMSMVIKKDLDLSMGPVPVMLYGYGSYGSSVDPGFDRFVLPYLDRGMAYVIAHVRGGGEMGKQWYEKQGKYLNKRNTFSDFINCAEKLIADGITVPGSLAIEGRSAGGLLVGAVLNMRPDLFNVAIAGVPFVDVMNTMSDPSIPLTTAEWEEWGNPNENKFHDYILSYSPYDNVREQGYPNILITCGLNDPRVPYWESVKWASKLRYMKTDTNEILVKIDMDTGHFSASDRYKYITERSFEQMFVLKHLELVDTCITERLDEAVNV